MDLTSVAPLTIPAGARPAFAAKQGAQGSVQDARELKTAFTQFVGETFYGQMIKSMRETVGEPAYFHGGSAEKQFQARLDQQMATDLAGNGGAGLAESLFEHQFPEAAATLRNTEQEAAENAPSEGLAGLDRLRRR